MTMRNACIQVRLNKIGDPEFDSHTILVMSTDPEDQSMIELCTEYDLSLAFLRAADDLQWLADFCREWGEEGKRQ